jgi:multicomponent Na+:H+ antiporter subunit B
VRKFRVGAFVIFGLVVAGSYGWAVLLLPAFGNYAGPYGDVLNRITMYERHATNVVTAVVFDYRGFDTMGEEYMLFIAIVGVLTLFRAMPNPDHPPHTEATEQSDAVRTFVLGLVDLLALFSLYIVINGHLTPGGGFQGGVMLTSAVALIYLSGSLESFMKIVRRKPVEIMEAIGVGGLAMYGLAVLAQGMPFFQNALPLGKTGKLLSAGSLPVLNVLTGLAVSMGMVLLIRAYLREVLEGGGGKE